MKKIAFFLVSFLVINLLSVVDVSALSRPSDYIVSGWASSNVLVDRIVMPTQDASNGATLYLWAHINSTNMNDTGLVKFNILVNGTQVSSFENYVGLSAEKIVTTFNFSSGIDNSANSITVIPVNPGGTSLSTVGYTTSNNAEKFDLLQCCNSSQTKTNVIMTEKYRIDDVYNTYNEEVTVSTESCPGELKAGTGFEYPINVEYKYTLVSDGIEYTPTDASIVAILDELPRNIEDLYRFTAGDEVKYSIAFEKTYEDREEVDTVVNAPTLIEGDVRGAYEYAYGWYPLDDAPTGYSDPDMDNPKNQYKYYRDIAAGNLETPCNDIIECGSGSTAGDQTDTYKICSVQTLYQGYVCWKEAEYNVQVKFDATPCIKQYDYPCEKCTSWDYTKYDLGRIAYNQCEAQSDFMFKLFECDLIKNNEYIDDYLFWQLSGSSCPKSCVQYDRSTTYAVDTGKYKPAPFTREGSYSINYDLSDLYGYFSGSFNPTWNPSSTIGTGLDSDLFKKATLNSPIEYPSDLVSESEIIALIKKLPEYSSCSSDTAFRVVPKIENTAIIGKTDFGCRSHIDKVFTDEILDMYSGLDEFDWLAEVDDFTKHFCLINGLLYGVDCIDNIPQYFPTEEQAISAIANSNFARVNPFVNYYANSKTYCVIKGKLDIPARREYYNNGEIITVKEAESWTFDVKHGVIDIPTGWVPDNKGLPNQGIGPWTEYDTRLVYEFRRPVGAPQTRTITEVSIKQTYEPRVIYIEDWTGEIYTSDNMDDAIYPLEPGGNKIYTPFCTEEGNKGFQIVGNDLGKSEYSMSLNCSYSVTSKNSLCPDDLFGVNQYYRPVELTDLFPGRSAGENWNTSEVTIVDGKETEQTVNQLVNEIETKGYTIYENSPKYDIDLSRFNIMKVRDYNNRVSCKSEDQKVCGYLNYYKDETAAWRFNVEIESLFK